MNFNNIVLVGRLGKDPEISYTANGMAMTKFTLAVNRIGKEREDVVDWFFITVFGKAAEAVSTYLTKGKLVLIKGRMESFRKDQDSPTLWSVIADSFGGVTFLEKIGSNEPVPVEE